MVTKYNLTMNDKQLKAITTVLTGQHEAIGNLLKMIESLDERLKAIENK
jgi:DNA-binding transcriptional regulator WhiA